MTTTSQQHLYRSVASIMVRRPPLPSNTTAIMNQIFENPLHSFIRHKDSSVFLVVKKPRKHNSWQFPQGGVDLGESVLQGALRELEEECGTDIKVNPIDKMPTCHYQYQFPEAFIAKHKRKHIGAKVEFIRSDWVSGQCLPDGEEIVDFAWLLESEVKNYVTPEYYDAIKSLFTYPSLQ